MASENIRQSNLLQQVSAAVPVEAFYQQWFPEWHLGNGNVKCPFHEDKHPSFSIMENGAYKCFACGAQGGGVTKFYADMVCRGNMKEALQALYAQYVFEPISDEVVSGMHHALMKDRDAVDRLVNERGWTEDAMVLYNIGLTQDGRRVSFPYFNDLGLCNAIFTVNAFGSEGYPKTNWLRSGMVTGHLWPLEVVRGAGAKNHAILLCEGHTDVMCALSQGIAAMTAGGAMIKYKSSDMDKLRNRHVVVCYDTDDVGVREGTKRAYQLMQHGDIASVKMIELPHNEKKHKDLSDWLHKEGRNKEDFFQLVDSADYFRPPPIMHVKSAKLIEAEGTEESLTSLEGVRDAKTFHKCWSTEAIVVGKEADTVMAPRQVQVTCKRPKKHCELCPLLDDPAHTLTLDFDMRDPMVLELARLEKKDLRREIKEHMGLSPSCKISIDVLSPYNITPVLLSPLYISSGPDDPEVAQESSEVVQVYGYYFGLNLQLNVPYLFHGYTARHPKDGRLLAVITEATSLSTTFDGFVMSDEVHNKLVCFRPPDNMAIWDYLMEYYEHAGESLTKILQRPLVHMAADLVFHSLPSFIFNGEFERKGSLDALIFGDPRCGKGYITEGFQRHYQHGEVVSGENVTLMSLLGGIKILKGFRGICWGRFAVNNKGTMIVDEMEAIPEEIMGRLSRLRSEGLAEIDKDGLHAKAPANCGVIWLSNPRDKRLMSQYEYGVNALKGLVPAPQDIARFDYVCAVSVDEVPENVVNQPRKDTVPFKHTKEACHELILWIKSRGLHQIKFTNEAVKAVLEYSSVFSKKYTKYIPLVLGTNIRKKIAKISAAIAGRLYSSDENGNCLVIESRHVDVAARFLDALYDNKVLGYRLFSDLQMQFEVINEDVVRNNIADAAHSVAMKPDKLAKLLLQHDHLTETDARSMLDYDDAIARRLMNALIKQNAIMRKGSFYPKTKKFIDLLKKMVGDKEKGIPDKNIDAPL